MKKIFFVVFLFIFSLFFEKPVLAANFSSFYKTTYEFDASGNSFINQEISLVNQQPDLFVSEYTLSLNGTQIENFQAFDGIGPISIDKTIKDETTLIKLRFNEKVVGKGKILSFIIKYQTKDLAEKKGNLWEITIPKLANSQEIDVYQLDLKVPLTFGKPTFINPKPITEQKTNNFYEISFDKEKIGSNGVLAVFGQWQTFDFSLDYELENSKTTPGIGKISLPPDSLYQDIYYESLSPLPLNVEVDANGNWEASYEVPANSVLKIQADGHVNLFSSPKKDFPQQRESLDQFLKKDMYWETSDPQIKALAEKLKTPKNIYNYVVKNLSYDKALAEKKVVRKGALYALTNPGSCLCSEFTDLFVALCRAAGIPARELEGYAYSDNPQLVNNTGRDLLHSWAEYYDLDKNYWVMVDPTFENTSKLNYFDSFDYNHFVFAIHGTSSQNPYPAGSFKTDTSSQQIKVSFGQDFKMTKTENYSVKEIFPKQLFSLKKNPVEIYVRNNNGYALYQQQLYLNKQLYFPSDFYFPVIPPFSTVNLVTNVRPKENFFDYQLVSNLTYSQKEVEFDQKVISLGLRGGLLTGIIVSLLIIMILKSLKNKNEKNTPLDNH